MIPHYVRHAQPSMLLSLDDEPWKPSQRLLELSAMLAAIVPKTEHPILSTRAGGGPKWFREFPGEHYHLLTALCRLLDPGVVWEFGTDLGMGSVALLEGLRPNGKLYTVDVVDWRSKPRPWLTSADLEFDRVTQVVCDMKSPDLFAGYQDSLAEAELIFVDGPKDGMTESAFLALLANVPFRHDPVVVFDDIRLMSMVHVWRGIQRPKMDLTSFGHWSGTGLVDWGASTRPPSRMMERPDRKPRPSTAPSDISILMLCHHKPNYVPDLLLHGLRKLLGAAVVDYPRKDALYEGCLGQPYLDRIDGLMPPDPGTDRLDILAKVQQGFFDLVLCDVRAVRGHQELLRQVRSPLALIDGEDRPVQIPPGPYVILRRETDGSDSSVPLPMALPREVLSWIDRHADAPKTRSIGFLGSRSNLTPDRNALIDELTRIFPDAMIDSWTVADGTWQGRDAYYRTMQSCKAVLNLPGAGFDTFRYWENAACNAAHVAKRMPLLIPNDFRDGREIVRFTNFAELADAIERIVSGELDWRALAAQSREWLLAHHTTERRATMTLDRLQAVFRR